MAVLMLMCMIRIPAHAETPGATVKVTLPSFKVTINGKVRENWYSEYPLLVYKNITYLPMTYNDARFLGLVTAWSASTGFSVTAGTEPSPAYKPYTRSSRNAATYNAKVASFRIKVNGKTIDNSTEPYPLLVFRDVTYFPLTWRFCVTEFNWDYSWSVSKGLMINCKGRPQTDIELQKFILHMAGSTADGTSGSNSVEAADNSYKKGYRWLEIDFNWTTDGKLVCIHDWGQWNNRFRTGKNGAVSYDEFQRVCAAANIYHPFTPASLETWLKNHSGAMIVTDVKDNNVKAMRWLKQNNPELMDRLIVQIYSFDEYEQVSALGYKHIILTMYKLSWADYHDFDKIDTFIRDTDVLAITMAAVDYTQDVFEHIKATGVPVYVHTLNTGSEQNAWLRKGAYGIYTDVGDAR